MKPYQYIILTALFFFISLGYSMAQTELNLRVNLILTDAGGKTIHEYELSHFSYYFTTPYKQGDEKEDNTVGISASLAQQADAFFMSWVAGKVSSLSGKIIVTEVEKRSDIRVVEFEGARIINLDESYMKGVNYRNSANFVFDVNSLKIDGQVIVE